VSCGVARLGPASSERECESLLDATGADEVIASLLGTRDLIRQLRSLTDVDRVRASSSA
jgi:hypothetical protein